MARKSYDYGYQHTAHSVGPAGFSYSYFQMGANEAWVNESEQITDTVGKTVKSFESSSTDGDKKHPNAYHYLKIDTPLSQTSILDVEVYGPYRHYRKTLGRGMFVQHIDDEIHLGLALERSVNKLYSKIRNSEINLATTAIVEGGESIELIRKYSKFLRRDAHAILRDAFKDIKSLSHKTTRRGVRYDNTNGGSNALNSLSGSYLEYQLALKPLVNDVYNIATHLTKSASQGDYYSIISTSIDDSEHSFIDGSGRTIVCTRRNLVKTGVTYKISNARLYEIHRLASFNPALWAWEKLPLSFVVDWFLDIGAYMRSLEGSLGWGLEFQYGFQSFLTHNKTATTLNYIGSDADLAQLEKNAYWWPLTAWGFTRTEAAESTYVKFDRNVLSSFPTPVLPHKKFLGVSPSASAGKLTTLAALLTSFISTGNKAWVKK
jgi:hypothetical protein